METDESQLNYIDFNNHPFDKSNTHHKHNVHKLFKLSKPKQITKEGKGIRQFLAVDESKLTMEQRFGKKYKWMNVNFEIFISCHVIKEMKNLDDFKNIFNKYVESEMMLLGRQEIYLVVFIKFCLYEYKNS